MPTSYKYMQRAEYVTMTDALGIYSEAVINALRSSRHMGSERLNSRKRII